MIEMDTIPAPNSEQDYLNKLQEEQKRIINKIPPDIRPQKENSITDTFNKLNNRLVSQDKFEFGNKQQAILKLKLARYFEREESCDVNTLYDAIVETPKFVNQERGSLDRLFEVHEQKTLQKIAEARRRRAEIGDKSVNNPWENLFTTKSGDYYLARLLNMPHLEQESEYMKHCVGTSDSYINRMKKGEIEIFSFRHVPKINPRTHRLEGDTPIITIQYDLKSNTIKQMKKENDEYLDPKDPYFDDVVDALKQLRNTKNDSGKLRNFSKISESELWNIKVDNYHLFTENGSVHFRDFDPKSDIFILKLGEMPITPDIHKTDVAKIILLHTGINYKLEEIAQKKGEIKRGTTKIYLGPLFPHIFDIQNIEIYTNFPEGKIEREEFSIGGKDKQQLLEELEDEFWFGKSARDIVSESPFLDPEEIKNYGLVKLTAKDLGLSDYTTTSEVYARAKRLGLKCCPVDLVTYYRITHKDQPAGNILYAFSDTIDKDGDLVIFYLRSAPPYLEFNRQNPAIDEFFGHSELLFIASESALV